MDERGNLLMFALPLGRFGGARVRLSVLFLPVFPLLFFRLGLTVSLVTLCTLVVSVLIHEIGHLMAARRSGSTLDELHLWPLGGLSLPELAEEPAARVWTLLGGIVANLLVCLACLARFSSEASFPWTVLNPFRFPVAEMTADNWGEQTLQIVFFVNYMLVLINLFPVWPLDVGQLLHQAWASTVDEEELLRLQVVLSLVCAGLAIYVGASIDHSMTVFLGVVFLLLTLATVFRFHAGEEANESFLGYDFSQGYTSLERSVAEADATSDDPPAADTEPTPSYWQRWRQRREQRQQRREQEQLQQAERRLDSLLAKVHEQGMNSLTEQERQELQRASRALQNRTKRPE